MKTSTYLYQVISYNFYVALQHLYMSLYIPIDYLKCWYFVISGKGTSGDYHLSMLASGIKRKGDASWFDEGEFLLFMNAINLAKLLKLDDERSDHLQQLFVGYNSYMHFYLDRDYFVWREHIGTIKTGEDFFKAITVMGAVGRPELIEKIDPELFSHLRTANMKIMRSILTDMLNRDAVSK